MSERPCVAVCAGKHCRRHDGYHELRGELSAVADVVAVRCVDLCDSPVAVVAPGSRDAVVFRKLRTPKQLGDLVALVEGGPVTPRLRARRVTGKRRRTVLRELAEQRLGKPDRS